LLMSWSTPARLGSPRRPDTLPAATLPPVLATAAPALVTKAFWSMITRPPSAPPAEPVADCMMLGSDLLPTADALPVLMVALPEFAAMPDAVFASCSRPASFCEALPTAALPPVLASATPEFDTVASWLITRMPPSRPWADPLATWLIVVLESLPTELAL